MALLAALSAGGCIGKTPDRPNIVLVSLDTVRADHLSLYGYERETSPRLERLAERSTLYTRAMATSPWTLPSHASMFTGKLPAEHGARTIEVDAKGNNIVPLDDAAVTLAERLREQGYLSHDLPDLIADAVDSGPIREALAPLRRPRDESPNVAENYYTRSKDLFHPTWGERFDRIRRVVFDWPHKYIHSSDGEHELYDLASDPDEAHDLIDENPATARRLRARLRELGRAGDSGGAADRGPLPRPHELSEEELEQMRALGYAE